MVLLARFFVLTLLNCFLRVRLPPLFAAVFKFFLSLSTSAISGAGYFEESAPTCFAAGTTDFRENGIAVLLITCSSTPNPRPRC